MVNSKTEENNIVEFITKHRITLIQLTIIVVLSYPLVYPLGLPIVISQHPKDFFSYIEDLEPGTKILFDNSLSAGSLGETLGSAVAFMHQVMDNDLKIYMVGLYGTDGVVMIWDRYIKTGAPPSDYGYEYGIDYVNLGYIPGGSVGMDAFARDVRKTLPYDNYGTPIDEIPMMDGITTLDDFDIIVGSDYPQTTAQQWAVPYNMALIQLGHQGQITRDLEPLYGAGIIVEYVAGSIHGAEYEKIIGKPGRALSMQDSLSLGQITIILFYILNNYWYLTHRGGKN